MFLLMLKIFLHDFVTMQEDSVETLKKISVADTLHFQKNNKNYSLFENSFLFNILIIHICFLKYRMHYKQCS